MSIFTKNHLLFDIKVKNQKDAFVKIATKAKELGVVDSVDNLVKGLEKRELVSTTGMKDSFAIPHAMSAKIKKPAIIAARFSEGVEWAAVDGKPVKFAVALLIPEKKLSTLHMEFLARISTALMDEVFCAKVLKTKNKKEIIKLMAKVIDEKNVVISKTKGSIKEKQTTGLPLIVGVTACATGIAHTFMGREALEKTGPKLGYEVHIETEGQNGREHVLTEELIEKAKVVIVATDINVDTDRFFGKKVYFCDTNQAINSPEKTIENAMKNAKVHTGRVVKDKSNVNSFTPQKKRSSFMKHLLSGVSHMIPFVVFSGIVFAIINAIGLAIGYNSKTDAGTPMWYALQVANVGFSLFVGVMAAYIAESIGGRAAFGPAFIGGIVASTPSLYWFWNGLIPNVVEGTAFGDSGTLISMQGISLAIFGALIMGFAGGYLVKWVNSWQMPSIMRSVMSILFIPVVCTSILVFPFLFVFSGPLGYLMNGFAYVLGYAGSIPGVNFLIGFVLGMMVGFDMGGPINKIAVMTASTLIELDPRLMGAVAAAIPVAPMGCGLATLINRKLFTEQEKSLGFSALALGFMGISEGAIPFFAQRPKQTVIANVVGSAVAGGLAFLFFVGGHVAMWGSFLISFVLGIYADPGQVGTNIPNVFGGDGESALKYVNILWYYVAIIAGIMVHSFTYIALIKWDNHDGSFKKSFATFKEKFKHFSKIGEKNKAKPKSKANSSKNNKKLFNMFLNENWYYSNFYKKQKNYIKPLSVNRRQMYV